MKKRDFLKITTYAAVFGLVGGMTFEGVNYAADKLLPSSKVESTSSSTTSATIAKTSTSSSTDSDSNTDSDGVSDVASEVLPSIVAINVTIEESVSNVFGQTTQQEEEGSGSGIIVGEDDDYIYIATNNHVVEDATKVSVTFNDDSVYSATVKGTDSDTDLAVVEIKMSALSSDTIGNIKVATLGDSDDVKVGEQAVAIGNALGYGTSVTVGYISAKDREVEAEDVTMKLLQTDAAINPGNSGGALVNSDGEVIGINSAKYADEDVEGMGFAIPISTAIPVIQDIINSEEVSEDEQAYLGITGSDISSEYAEYYNMPEGIYVASVSDGSPAATAGLEKGDVIVSFNGSDTTTMDGLKEKLERCKAGDKVKVVVKRLENGEYKSVTLSVTLGKKSDASDSSDSSNSSNSGNSDNSSGNSSGNSNGNSSYGSSGNSNGSSSYGSYFGSNGSSNGSSSGNSTDGSTSGSGSSFE